MKQEKQEKYTLSPQIEQYFPRPRPAPPPRHGVRCRTNYLHPFLLTHTFPRYLRYMAHPRV